MRVAELVEPLPLLLLLPPPQLKSEKEINKPYSCNKLCIKAEESIEITRFEP